MSEQIPSQPAESDQGTAQPASALFAELVLQQTQLALMLMGKIPNPHTGKTEFTPDQARFSIEMLEMLQLKTKGNLTKDEDALLKHSLTTLRMAFVEAIESAPAGAESAPEAQSNTPAGTGQPNQTKESQADSTETEEQPRRKFFKKY